VTGLACRVVTAWSDRATVERAGQGMSIHGDARPVVAPTPVDPRIGRMT
jgi:hypothetical protein